MTWCGRWQQAGLSYEEAIARSFKIPVSELEKIIVLCVEQNQPKLRPRDPNFKYHPHLFPRSPLRVEPKRCPGCEDENGFRTWDRDGMSDEDLGIAFYDTDSELEDCVELDVGKFERNQQKLKRLVAARNGEAQGPADGWRREMEMRNFSSRSPRHSPNKTS